MDLLVNAEDSCLESIIANEMLVGRLAHFAGNQQVRVDLSTKFDRKTS